MANLNLEPRPAFIDQVQALQLGPKKLLLCQGLDPDPKRMPSSVFEKHKDSPSPIFNAYTEFLQNIIDATGEFASCFKPNAAFFEAQGEEGMAAYRYTISYIRKAFPEVPILKDGKRADIGNTNDFYAKAAFYEEGVDAITTNPYFGRDTYPSFLDYTGRGLIPMCKTSNQGSAEYQNLTVPLTRGVKDKTVKPEERDAIKELTGRTNVRLYWLVAYRHGQMANENPNIGIVVGATHPEAFIPVRKLAPDILFLVPGIGSQGGDLEKTLRYAPARNGANVLISSSSAIIFASKGEDYAEAAHFAARDLHQQMQQLRHAA
jgi:orotidine-5'-phosphate decarboxylase